MSRFCLVRRVFRALALAASALLPTLAPAARAQTPPAQPAGGTAAKVPDVSKEAVVIDKLSTRIREEDDGTGTRQVTARIRVLADAGVKDMAVLAFTYTASNEQIDINYVRVTKPDGSVVVTPDYNVQDLPADVTREAPMYSDVHQKHVAVRGLGVGDTLEYQITQRTTKPDVPGQFWLEYSFEKNLVILDEELDLDIPADRQVTVASADVQPTITTQGARKLYHWTSSNLSRPDPDAPPKSVKKWKPSVQVTTFTSWEQVGAWYASLQKQSVVVTPAIQTRADQLTRGLSSEEDKVRAIFNDVALHIHYVALEFGIGRYQPHSADDVLANEYGDCKDKHTLLAAMLKAAGIDSWPVLIPSSRELDPNIPSPGQFDHVITVVPIAGKLLWMDSTEEIAPVGVLMSSLRDKQALAVPIASAAYLERTPADLPYVQSTRFQASGKLDDQGTFTGKIQQTYHGDGELVMRELFRSVPQSQWNEFLQRMSNAIGFAGDVKNSQVSAVEQTSQPLDLSYDYTRQKFGEWDSRRISPPLPPVGWELAPGVKTIKPADDVDIGSPGEQVYTASVQLPPGWTLVPPAPKDVTEDWAEYHAKYTFKDGTFTAERRLVVRKDKIPLSDWEKYLNFRRAIYDDTVGMEQLFSSGEGVKPAASFDPNLPAARQQLFEALLPLRDVLATLMGDSPASADQIAQAASASGDALASVEAKSAAASADDPGSLYWAEGLATVWCFRGWTALEANDLATADIYLRAAWRVSQDPVSGYLLGRLLEAKGNKLAAAHQYQLAHITGARSLFGGLSPQDYEIRDRIAEAYKRVTGKELTATEFRAGAYNGSMQEELDKQTEIKQLVHATKLTGQALYSLTFEEGKPAKAALLSGDKGFNALAPVLQAHPFPAQLPSGSKARLIREVRVVCSPWAGCDAWLLLTGSIEMPSHPIKLIKTSEGAKTVKIEKLPVAPPSN